MVDSDSHLHRWNFVKPLPQGKVSQDRRYRTRRQFWEGLYGAAFKRIIEGEREKDKNRGRHKWLTEENKRLARENEMKNAKTREREIELLWLKIEHKGE